MDLSRALSLVVALDEMVKLLPTVDNARLAKALTIAKENKVEYRASLRLYFYRSPRQSQPYAINIERALHTNDLSDAACTCQDFVERGAPCKHIMAAWLDRRATDILQSAEQLRTIAEMDSVARYVQWAFG